jgi:hypothetical protein
MHTPAAPALKVMFYVGRELVTARLVFKNKRAFAFLSDSEPRNSKNLVVHKRVELDVSLLKTMNPALGADYFYQRKAESPDPV